MNDLREEDEVAEDDHPFVVAEEVNEGEVEEESQVCIEEWVQNWM